MVRHDPGGWPEGVAAAVEIIQALTGNSFPDALYLAPGTAAYRSTWEETIAAAEKYNEPGRYTALHGYEWTSTEKGANRHRVVIYRDGADKVSMMEPYTSLPPYGSPDERDLWKWLQSYEDKTGGRILAIAHNGNLSNGAMFPVADTFTGKPYDRAWAEERIRWEPLYEITQIKGDGETHPFLSPDDEFADYETWDQGNLDLSEFKTERDAAVRVRPLGARNRHRARAEARREPLQVRLDRLDRQPHRPRHRTGGQLLRQALRRGTEREACRAPDGQGRRRRVHRLGHGRLRPRRGVGPREHPRGAVRRDGEQGDLRTTGSRMLVRFFGGWSFTAADAQNRLPAAVGYGKACRWAATCRKGPAASPRASWSRRCGIRCPATSTASRSSRSGSTRRGKRKEKVFDVAWSGDRKPGRDGKLPKVGNTVDVANATWTNTIGSSPELITVWTDPGVRPGASRGLLRPRARDSHTAVDRIRRQTLSARTIPKPGHPADDPVERAYTSPIWYTP